MSLKINMSVETMTKGKTYVIMNIDESDVDTVFLYSFQEKFIMSRIHIKFRIFIRANENIL